MKTSALGKICGWLMIGGLLLIAGCAAGGEVQTYRAGAYPVYSSPYYYPDLRRQEDDPQFWQSWQDYQGGP